MKKLISELELLEIDYLVAEAEGLKTTIKSITVNTFKSKHVIVNDEFYHPTTNPAQAWPIIERDKIQSIYSEKVGWCCFLYLGDNYFSAFGSTLLEAAMRCFVAYKFGDKVEI